MPKKMYKTYIIHHILRSSKHNHKNLKRFVILITTAGDPLRTK